MKKIQLHVLIQTWFDIRDDSSLLDIASSRLYENMDLTADDADTSQNCGA